MELALRPDVSHSSASASRRLVLLQRRIRDTIIPQLPDRLVYGVVAVMLDWRKPQAGFEVQNLWCRIKYTGITALDPIQTHRLNECGNPI